MTESTHDSTEFDPTDLYRSDPAATFVGHLFNGADVRAAGVENGDRADHPVPPLCSRRTDRGPFETITPAEIVAYDESDLCGKCLDVATRRLDASAELPFSPEVFTVDELRYELESSEFTAAELAALRDAERESADRATAIDAIESCMEDDA